MVHTTWCIQTNVFNKEKKKEKERKKETVNESWNAGFALHASGRNTLKWPESGHPKYDEAMTKSRNWRGIRFRIHAERQGWNET